MSEITNPESDKFTAPLVLVHGLWGRPADWRRFAGYLAHRGWRCIAVERAAQLYTIEAIEAALRREIAALDAPPVLVGHDFGALLALRCADVARAVVGLAPIVGPPLAEPPAALLAAGSWLERWRGGGLHPPRSRAHAAYPARDRTEPLALIRQVTTGIAMQCAPSAASPRVVFAMDADEVTPAAAARSLAERCGAQLQVGGGDHAVMASPRWEPCVAAVHRWIVRELGVDLLALYDEAWDGREP